MTKSTGPSNPAYEHLRAAALRYPETVEEFPWGHSAIKVRGKAFVFMSSEGGKFGLSCKLPRSHEAALLLPFATPTGYGLGKSGWVSASFAERDGKVPVALLEAWIGESYRAVAPKKLAATLADVFNNDGRSEGAGGKAAAKAGASAGKKAVKRGSGAAVGLSGRSEGAGGKRAAKAGASAGKKAAKAVAGKKTAKAVAGETTAKAGSSGRSSGTGKKTAAKRVSGRRAG